jgi:hypothetical protein
MTSPTFVSPSTPPADVRDIEGASMLDNAVEDMNEQACDACPHPHAAHDVISARFCSATLTNAIARGCICPS